MEKYIISRIFSIFSLILIMAISYFTMDATIAYSFVTNPTEGMGIIIVPIVFFNALSIIIAFMLNTVAYLMLPRIDINALVEKRNIMPFIIALLPIIVFITEMVIL